MLAVACLAAVHTSVIVNGKRLQSLPHTVNGVVYLPVFPVCRALGRHAVYDPRQHRVLVEGQPVKTAVRIWDDQVYLPASALAKAAGASLVVDKSGQVKLAAGAPPGKLAHQSRGSGSPGAPHPVSAAAVAVATPPPPPYLMQAPGTTSTPPTSPDVIPESPRTPGIVPTNVPWTIPVDWPPKGMPSNTKFPGQDNPSSVAHPPPDITAEPPPAGGPIVNAPPDLGSAPVVPGPVQPPIGLAPTAPLPVPYQPRTGSNGVFAVTVTNVERIASYHSHYQPKAGYQFIMVSLSEQNISSNAQVYTGRFSLQDTTGNTFEVEDGLSNFFPVILSPQGTNFGYLTFEIPVTTAPLRLLLNAEAGPPVSVALQ
jgi:hypothetical protein